MTHDRPPTPATESATPLVCPLCHVVHTGTTTETMDPAVLWQCPRCGQTWDAGRLATAAAYERYVAERGRSTTVHAFPDTGARH